MALVANSDPNALLSLPSKFVDSIEGEPWEKEKKLSTMDKLSLDAFAR